jgi:hypothetical protein
MLWTLLTLISSLTFLLAAVVTAHNAKVAFGGYAVAIAVGLVLGLSNAWALERVAAVAGDRLERESEKFREWCLGVLYVAAAVWALVAASLGAWITSAAMRLIA